MQALWMVIDLNDKELPLCVGTAEECARFADTTRWTVYSSRSHARKHGYRSKFVKIEESAEE